MFQFQLRRLKDPKKRSPTIHEVLSTSTFDKLLDDSPLSAIQIDMEILTMNLRAPRLMLNRDGTSYRIYTSHTPQPNSFPVDLTLSYLIRINHQLERPCCNLKRWLIKRWWHMPINWHFGMLHYTSGPVYKNRQSLYRGYDNRFYKYMCVRQCIMIYLASRGNFGVSIRPKHSGKYLSKFPVLTNVSFS